MDLKRMLDEYAQCNIFEIKIINNETKIYFYDKVDVFSESKIVVISKDKKVTIEGKHLSINEMYKEELTIGGKIEKILLGDINE
ncbi:MAG: YabP/YqfC family sporulation protein [Bacilli bacterium]